MYLARTVLGSSCWLLTSAAGLLYLVASLYLSERREQEQLRRV